MSTLTELRGPARVVVRQHRWTLRVAGGLALVVAIGLIAVCLRSSHVAEVFAASDCPVNGGAGRACDVTTRAYLDSMLTYRDIFHYAAALLTVLPVLLSAFVAGPLIARELESGTFRLSWTQSVSPARWLASKLAVPAVLLVAGVTVLSAILTWARTQTADDFSVDWLDPQFFDTTLPLVIGYTLLGIAVGALTGLLLRRTVAAMAVAVAATGTVMVTLSNFRRDLWPPRTANAAAPENLGIPLDSWVLDSGRVNASGNRVSPDVCWGQASEAQQARCMADHHITGWFFDYHPASHLWPLQLVETGIVLALTALAVAVAFRVLRRRTA